MSTIAARMAADDSLEATVVPDSALGGGEGYRLRWYSHSRREYAFALDDPIYATAEEARAAALDLNRRYSATWKHREARA